MTELEVEGSGRRSRGRPPTESVPLIEEELLEVALQEFLQHGYGGASISRIVKVARISKTTLYSRYRSKDELFRAIMRQQVERLSVIATLTGSAPLNLEAGLKAYANRTLAISLSGDLMAVNRLIYSEAHRFPELGLAAAERTQVGIAQVAWFIKQCSAASGLGSNDCHTAAEAFILLLRGWYVNAMLSSREISGEERESWVERVVPVFIAGCCR
ncbi:TetR/AcrR family transcriptional regulator [Novosphingobium sp. 9U]|uniref:TetR/AcrR family transcriptional regulator n=1 Tax=Novosphingobium sp. 9U TaxID=2653158 RepID=UPI001F349E3E|nr:TetR/AcrR family transcriptional regulator [Novosphingobium sp. 9U]